MESAQAGVTSWVQNCRSKGSLCGLGRMKLVHSFGFCGLTIFSFHVLSMESAIHLV